MEAEIKKEPEPIKSSAEILSELFGAFNAEPPELNRDSEERSRKKHKKSKKKYKHKEKKHKKKSKHKRKNSPDSEDSSDSESPRKKHKSRKKHKDLNVDINDVISIKKEPDDTYNTNTIKIKQETINDRYNRTYDINIKIKDELVEKLKKETDTNGKSDETKSKNDDISKSSKIIIKNLKNSVVYEKTIREVEENTKQVTSRIEDGELTDSDNGSKSDEIPNDHILDEPLPTKYYKKESTKHDKKRKHSEKKHDESKKSKKEKSDHKEKYHIHRSSSKDKHSRKKNDFYSKSTHSHRSSKDHKYDKHRTKSRSRSRDKHRSRSRSRDRRSRSRDRYHSRDRYRSRSRSRSRDRWERRYRSKSPLSSSIDKKKLLEIARRNAINMLKSGTLPDALTLGPQAQEKVIAAIKAGGKTIEELTDFCKNLSKKEALGELSSVSSGEEDLDSDNESNIDKVFHHPFQIKDKPASIVMNIKNATPLPIKTSKEKSAELRMQFPVSSGQLHRKTENEWVPVSPKTDTAVVPIPAPVAPILPPPIPKIIPPAQPIPPVIPKTIDMPTPSEVDIGAIVSQRLSAIRRLQENPNDSTALVEMQKAQKNMECWAQSKQQPGQFTGSTGANILTAAELSSGYQAWARKDQLQNAAPVMGGMGMHLLQKMGWKPGEGLGKEKSGQLEPLLLEVKLDKKGLVAGGETKNKKPIKTQKAPSVKTLAGKHPVSLLGEFASKKKLGVPNYEVCFECGPDHKKNFLFKVILNGVEYKPNVVSSTKKQAKADAATICLQALGVLPI